MTSNLKNGDIVAARVYGVSFIASFLSYGFGTATMEGIFADANVSLAVESSASALAISVLAMILIHTFANVSVARLCSGSCHPSAVSCLMAILRSQFLRPECYS